MNPMLACVDVDYRPAGDAVAGCVLFEDWSDDRAADMRLARIARVEEYVPGQFYKRELPCLLAVLSPIRATVRLDAVIVDGYVWLDEHGTPGLGAHLYEALGRAVPVVGVAKTGFGASAPARRVLRGASLKPLFVTAAGMDADEAAGHVRAMHGENRIPTLLRLVDRLCRNG